MFEEESAIRAKAGPSDKPQNVFLTPVYSAGVVSETLALKIRGFRLLLIQLVTPLPLPLNAGPPPKE